MKEYERSFKVDNIEPFIEYCQNNGFKLTSQTRQNRKVYQSKYNKDLIVRITTINDEKTILDSKNNYKQTDTLNESIESSPIDISKLNIKEVESFLEVMDFTLAADNIRIRYVYEKDDIKFEIDDYTKPVMKVIAIEGNEEKVEKLYLKLNKDQRKV